MSAALLDNSRSVEQRAEAVIGLRAAYGDRYAEMMDQVIRDGHLDEGWRGAASGQTREEIQSSVGALVGRKDMEKNFEVVAKARGMTDQTLDDAAARKLGPYIQAMSQRNPNDPRASSIISQKVAEIRTKAKQLIIDTPNLSEEEAIKRAGDSLLFDKYHFVETGGGGGLLGMGLFGTGAPKNITAIPKHPPGGPQINDLERDRIIEYTQANLKPEALKSLGILPPPGPGGKPGAFDEKFYEQAAATGQFITAPNERGLTFRWLNRNTGRYERGMVKDSKGSVAPIVIPWAKVVLPGKPDGKMESVKPPVFRGDGR